MRFARRVGAIVGLAVPLFAAMALLAAPAALAHPLGNFTVNHHDGLRLTPGHVRVTYALDMAEIPTFQQRSSIDADGDGSVTAAERAAWATVEAASLSRQLDLRVDGRRVALSNDCGSTMAFRPGQGGLPVLRMVAVYDAAVPAAGSLAFRDATFGGRIGWKEVTARGAPGVTVTGSSVPAESASHGLLRYPTNLLQNPLAVTEASLAYSSSAAAPGPACPRAATAAPRATTNAFASLITWNLTPLILTGSLALAFGFGVLHALGPGHGKTITAAYLVGSGARPRQAIGVGAAVASMHTLSVLGLGLLAVALSASFPAERIYPWLTVATGAMALGLGGALLVRRVGALRRGEGTHGHRHQWHDHADQASHAGHAHRQDERADPRRGGNVRAAPDHASPVGGESGADQVSRPRLAALAVSGGILPSPTALVVLLAAISAHRVAYGLSLIVAFSAGLAAALIAIALLALRARGVVDRRLDHRVARAIPVLSAFVIVGFGAFFLTKGLLVVGG